MIHIAGARTHNLKNIDVSLPRRALTVITGVSGSGKSSLAFQTVFAEGQRRMLRNLTGSGRSWLSALPRPDVDAISGLPPVIAVRQEQLRPGPRSTVANVTEVLDYLRVLFARVGVLHCPECGLPILATTAEETVAALLRHPPGTKLLLLAPVVRAQPGDHQAAWERMEREGFVRARVNGEIIELGEPLDLPPEQPHTLEAVVDRLILKEEIGSRLSESVQQALRLGEGCCVASVFQEGHWRDEVFQNQLACPGCSRVFPPLEPSLFSWSNARGACPRCAGTGELSAIEETDQAWLEEDGSTPTLNVDQEDGDASSTGKSPGKKSTPATEGEPFEIPVVCPDCRGSRLNEVATHVRVAGKTLPELLALCVPDARGWLRTLPESAEAGHEQELLRKLIEPLLYRLEFLEAVGLGYLSLNRAAETLSGGELQRARLARCLGTQLQGSCYILDEPTAGLHARDVGRLLEILRKLTAAGNTVICVEHHLDVVAAADHIIELGPQGGRQGGEVLFQGNLAALSATQVPTAHAFQLSAHVADSPESVPQSEESAVDGSPAAVSTLNTQGMPGVRDGGTRAPAARIRLLEVRLHNLKNVSLEFPADRLVCVTGVSGSGKSTLILDALAPLLREAIQSGRSRLAGGERGNLEVEGQISALNVVDQRPPGQQSRSCPATYSGMWHEVQKVLAKTRTARVRGFGPSRFAIHSRQGTCPECRGRGERTIPVSLLGEQREVCPVCGGQRFNPATLSVQYQGRHCGDLLRMTIDEALDFWQEFASIVRKLKPFQDIGIGYLTLGQSARALSGGEMQRMKLARELSQPRPGSLLILDEPTSGLHWLDVGRLVTCLWRIVEQGSGLLVIEHHPLLRAAADWWVELGPAAAEAGGRVMHSGPTARLALQNGDFLASS
jgi:excinuclease ABC subunit A